MTKTWEESCQEILDKLAEGMMKLRKEAVIQQQEYFCDVCGMKWSCLTNLDGVKHKALAVKCGGSWRKSNGSGKTEVAKAAEGGGIPVPESERHHQGA